MSAVKKINPENQTWNNRILVVDDEKTVANCYHDILSFSDEESLQASKRSSRSGAVSEELKPNNYNFNLTIVYNASAALAEVKKAKQQGQPFCMGFFDIKLGVGLNGVELVREIHKICPDLFAVFVTADNARTINSIQKVLGKNQANQWDYLNKPFSSCEIIQKARNFSTLWNLNIEKQHEEKQIQELHEKLLGSERMNSVSAVARGVGHEFGNILMQIMGKAELSLDKDAEGMRQGLNKVIDASSRAMEILDRFKDLTNVNDMDCFKEQVKVKDILSETLDLMERQISISKLEVEVNYKNDGVIYGNFTSFMQVFINIIINAIHAMGDQGKIIINLFSNDENVYITFRDYGPGIKQQLLYKVTEPLFTTKGDQGTGLGLSICKEIIEIEHRGKFNLDNHKSGKGLVIEIVIPKNRSEE